MSGGNINCFSLLLTNLGGAQHASPVLDYLGKLGYDISIYILHLHRNRGVHVDGEKQFLRGITMRSRLGPQGTDGLRGAAIVGEIICYHVVCWVLPSVPYSSS